jgi:hypothetical protein
MVAFSLKADRRLYWTMLVFHVSYKAKAKDAR